MRANSKGRRLRIESGGSASAAASSFTRCSYSSSISVTNRAASLRMALSYRMPTMMRYGSGAWRDNRCPARLPSQPLERNTATPLRLLGTCNVRPAGDDSSSDGTFARSSTGYREFEKASLSGAACLGPLGTLPHFDAASLSSRIRRPSIAMTSCASRGRSMKLEQLAIEAVLVQLNRRPVRRGHDPDSGREQFLKQARRIIASAGY